jgi:DNA primase catalytic subunit
MVEEKKTKTPAKPVTHPPFQVMVAAAVKSLAEKGGSSRKAILKYVMANYDVNKDMAKVQTRVKLAVRKMLADKKLVPGSAKSAKGRNMSFKLAEKAVEKKEKKSKKVKKPVAKKVKKPAAKKAKKPKAAKKAKKPVAAKVKKDGAKKPAGKRGRPKKQ